MASYPEAEAEGRQDCSRLVLESCACILRKETHLKKK